MVASLYEWKILEWDDKPNTNNRGDYRKELLKTEWSLFILS